jgi:hypothetical protein
MNDLIFKRYIFKNLKLGNYKRNYRLMNDFPNFLKDALIGILLSDGGLERSSNSSNVRLSVIMSMNNYPYIFHLYNLFEPYIDTDLKIMDVNKLYKTYCIVRFKTISLPKLLYYYNIFYKKSVVDNKIKKIVPKEIYNKFNEISLAHLIMGDGNFLKERNIIRIYTNSFNKEDVLFLYNIINKLLYIKSKVVHDRNDQFIIIIEKDDINIVHNNIVPFMHPSMLYKLGIQDNNTLIKKFDYLSILNDI